MIEFNINPYSIAPAIVAGLVLVLGFFIYSLDKKSPFYRSLLYLCISIAVWFLGCTFLFNSRSPSVALFWVRVFTSGLTFLPATILHVSIAFTNRHQQEKPLIMFGYITALIFVILSWSEVFLKGLREYYWGFYPDAGYFHILLIIFILSGLALAVCNLLDYYRHLTNYLEKKRTQTLIVAFVFILFANIDLLPSYGYAVYPFGYIAVLCFVLSITYSIITHHYLTLDRYTKRLESQVDEKTQEISKMVNELRSTQLRLIETGKISAMASLSAGILHQISQPITAIQGFAKFMGKEMSPDDKFYRPVKLMEEQSAYLKEMLEDLMELIRHREIKKENIDINHCIKKATDLLTDELRIRRVNWEVNCGDHLPSIYADAIHIQQVFMNICVNAMQALSTLPKGSPRSLRIISQFDREKEKIVVLINDSGPGLTLDDKNQIFEPFFTTKTKGSGIGLALCKDLIAEHGGTIGVESEEGMGTKFIISFPPAKNI